MKYSKCLLNTGVSDIGRRSFSSARGGLDFGTGVTIALFHDIGMDPSRIELLKIHAIGLAIKEAQSANIQFGRLSGPTALRVFVAKRRLLTSSTLTMKRSGTVSGGPQIGVLSSCGRSVEIL